MGLDLLLHLNSLFRISLVQQHMAIYIIICMAAIYIYINNHFNVFICSYVYLDIV